MNAVFALVAWFLAAVTLAAVGYYLTAPFRVERRKPVTVSQLRRRQLEREVSEGGYPVEWPGEAIDGGWQP